MAKTMGDVRCEFCRQIREHLPGCPTEMRAPEAAAVYRQAYEYAYWHRDLRQEILQRRSPTFRVGYMIGKSDRDFADQAEEEDRWRRRQLRRRITGTDGNKTSGLSCPMIDPDCNE